MDRDRQVRKPRHSTGVERDPERRCGRLVAGDQSTASSFRIALDTGRVTRLPDLAVPVHDLGGASLHGEPTIFGGGNATEQDVVQRPTPSGGWEVVGQLP